MLNRYTIWRNEKSGAVSDAIYNAAVRRHPIQTKVIGIRTEMTDYERSNKPTLSAYDFYGKIRK